MNKEIRILILYLSTVALVAALIGALVVVVGDGNSSSSPRAAFEAHLLALDENRLDDANALVDITCGRVTETDVDAARDGLEDAGYTFQTAFQVETVWTNDRGAEAILEITTPPNLPLPGVQGMMKVEGEWLLSCGY